jgi:subtilisin family serine protease
MRVIALAIALSSSALLLGFGAARDSSPPDRDAASSSHAAPFQDGRLLVGFHKWASRAQRRAAEARAGVKEIRTLGAGVHLTRVPRGKVLSAARILRGLPGVRYAEPDYIQREAGVPNDPSFGLQWGYRNTGQSVNGTVGVAGADERAVPAWDVSTGSNSIVIGEVDTGVEYTHPDLAANIWSNPGGIGGCPAGTHGYNVIAATCDPMDDDTVYGGHGTHVAGIMGAVGNNGIGVTGVNQSATILPVKWVSSGGSGTTSNLIAGLDWLLSAKNAGVNVRVVNDSEVFVGTAYSQALSDEIDLLGQNGILFVTAAGNTSDNNDNPAVRRYPCGYARPTEICVAASNQQDALPSWANYGITSVDLAAPGDNVYSTVRGGSYGYISGSSMASPQVAGAAALILSRQDMSPTALKADILQNVDKIPSLSGTIRTGGRLNICSALPSCTQALPTATFGLTTIGANSDTMVADRKRVNRFSLTAAGSVSKLTMYLAPTGTSGQQLIKGVIYADQSGLPGALLAVSNQFTFHSTDAAGWYDFTFPSSVALQPGTYWIGVISGGTSNVTGMRWKSVASSRALSPNSYASGPTNPFGTGTIDAEQMSVYATYTPAPPPPPALFNVTPPSVTGTAQQGQVLSAGNGDWTGSPTGFAYQWRRCSSTGTSCANVAAATTQTYTLTSADVGSTMQVSVTATKTGASSTGNSVPSLVVQSAGTANTFGKTTVGGTTDAADANWKRVDKFTISQAVSVSKLTIYLQRLVSGQQVLKGVIYGDQSGTPGALLGVSNEVTFGSSATSGWFDLPFAAPITLQPGTYWIGLIDGATTDVFGLRYDAVASSSAVASDTYSDGPTNPFGTPSRIDSEQISVYATYTPASAAPVNTALPTVSGSAVQGQTLSATQGTWSNSPTGFAYQWRDCDGSGANCVDIPGATSSTYVLAASDVNSTVLVAVTASNAGGSTTAASAPTGVVQATLSAPVNTALPTVSGSATQGQALSASQGSWSNSPTGFAYQWRDCDGSGANCVDIPGATSTTYLLTASDVNSTVRVLVTASNAAGSGSASSAQTAVVQAGSVSGNPIVLENQQPGTSQWQLGSQNATDVGGQIKGYASATSVNKGENITFYVSVNPVQQYSIDVYRMGWYQGLGGRLMQHIGPLDGVQQPTCPTNATTGLIACNWSPSYTLATQTSWTSGIYLAKLTNDQGWQNYITFTVRDDARHAALLFQQSVDTYQAYNNYPNDGSTGKSLYGFNSYGATTVTGGPQAAKVSFDRPYAGDGDGDFLQWEVNFVRWIEKSGYDVSYATNVDTSTNGARLLNYRGFLSVGHDEYWTKPAYDAVIAARDAGVNLAFFSANAIFWQVRYEPSAGGAPNRVMVGYKSAATDPTTDPSLETVNWRDPILNRPEQTLIGVQYTNQLRNNAYVPYIVGNSGNWVYAGTGFKDGDSVPGVVGYEGDRVFSQYPGPTAVSGTYTQLSNSPFTADNGTPDHANSSVYQALSGAWVFGAGTIGWSWGLDDYGAHGAVDPRLQQTTANILDRFTGASPAPPGPPANTSAPLVAGLALQGQTLTAQPGGWSNNPARYTYQWRDCDAAGLVCTDIPGATLPSYTVASSDVNSAIVVAVTASNSGGAGTASSVPTGVVQPGTTVGLTSIGANSDQMVADRKRAVSFQVSSAGSISKLSMYLAPTGTQGQQVLKGVIYADAGGAPGALLGTSNELTFHSSDQAGWYDLFFSAAVPLQPGTYWMGVITGATSNVAGIRYNNVPGARAINSNTYDSGPSDPFGPVTTDAEQMSLYASYSTGATPPAPVNQSLPTISGTAQEGNLLSAQPGTWTNDPVGYSYQWRTCDAAGANCSDIPGATSVNYTPVEADVNSTLRVSVTASNGGGSTTAASAPTAAVQPALPQTPTNTSPPTITGTAQQGQILTSDVGTWLHAPTSFATQWRRCDSAGANCSDIAGATSSSYPVTGADVGSTIVVAVTGSNSIGSSTASSAPTPIVQPPAPPNTFGVTSVGTTVDKMIGDRKRANHFQLSVAAGVSKLTIWLEPTTAVGQQVLKGVVYADQGGMPGALLGTSNEFTFHSTDSAGWYDLVFSTPIQLPAGTYWLGVISGATNNVAGFRYVGVAGARALNTDTYSDGPSDPFGSATLDSEQVSIYGTYSPTPSPVNTGLPTVSGSAVQGQTLSASQGTWSNSPTGFAYQWRRCDGSGAGCADIASATSSTYVLAAADVGSTLRVVVTASNGGGSGSATSAQTAVVQSSAGTGIFGLSTIGSNSDTMGTDRKRVNRFALSAAGSVFKLTMYLAPTGTSGQQVIKGVVYADQGGSPGALLGTSNEFTFHSTDAAGWYDFTFASPISLQVGTYWIGVLSGTTSNVAGFRWNNVSGSRALNSDTYSDGASPTFGTATIDTEQMSVYATYNVAAPPAAPVNTALPTSSGTAVQGQTLSAQPGAWSNNPASYAYQWRRCDATGSSCTDIAAATSTSYVLTAADIGSTLRVAVTATNGGGSASAVSTQTAVVAGVFGFTTIGGNTDVMGADRKRVVHFQLPQAGQVSKLTMYLTPTSTSGQQQIKGVIYGDAAGVPGSLLAVSNELIFHSTDAAGWYDLAFPSPVALPAGTYWIGVMSGGTSNVTGFRYSTVTGIRALNTNTYTSGPSNPFGTATIDAEQMSIYATYLPG